MTTGRAHTRTLATDPLGGTVRRTVLPNGLRLITEAIPAMRSVSFGVWVGVGSRDETPALSGASHFLEHLLFKGTERRTALDITAEIEAVGGETNAFTTKEYTCYYARVLDADLPLAVDVVCDLVTDSILAEADVETERGVILEEIAMHDDEPGDEVPDLFAGAVYAGHPLARQVSGTVETISAMTRRQIQSFYGKRYTAPSIVVAAAGLFAVYAGCAPGKVDEVLALTREELARVADKGLTDAEVDRGKGMVKGSLVLGLEDTGSRMSRLGKGELLHKELLSVDDLLARVDAVTPDQVRAVASEILAGTPSLAVIGPFDNHDFAAAVR